MVVHRYFVGRCNLSGGGLVMKVGRLDLSRLLAKSDSSNTCSLVWVIFFPSLSAMAFKVIMTD